MSGHTPGPWEAVLPDDVRGQPVPYYRGLICCVSHEEPTGMLAVVTKDGSSVPKADWEANARLIAAAPDMLEALKEVVRVHSYEITLLVSDKVYAAIAKAEGQACEAGGSPQHPIRREG